MSDDDDTGDKGGRPRGRNNTGLPNYTRKKKSGFYYHNRTTGEYKKLGGPDATMAEIWRAHEDMAKTDEDTVDYMITQYFKSDAYISKAPATQRGYTQDAKDLREVFGPMAPDDVTSVDVQQFMDKAGAKYKTKANHARSLLSIIFNWGKARGHCNIANPVTAVKPIKTKPAGRYVDHDDYWAFREHLIEKKNFQIAATMTISYLCGSRQQDVLRLLRKRPRNPKAKDCYVCDEGLVIVQGKTEKAQLKRWNPDLRAAVQFALDHTKTPKVRDITKVPSLYVITSRTGTRYSRTGFNAIWQRRRNEAIAAGVISESFRFHDMKVKAASDFEGDDLAHFTGHKTKGMAERYNRTPDKVSALRDPTKPKKD